MSHQDVLHMRLYNQKLIGKKFADPAEAVRWFGAVQAQDYQGAKWGVGQRIEKATDRTLEAAFEKGEIIRTHVMRPTWHFVHPKDIRWMLMLTAPRVRKMMSFYNKKLELTDEVFTDAQKAIVKILQGKKALTRQELKTELSRIDITTDVQRLAHIVMQAELDGVICSGPRRGKQFTYMLLEERVPQAKSLTRDEALFELTQRYFTSHGPATVKDFAWWSGLTVADAKKGIDMNNHFLNHEEVDAKIYWFYNNPTTSHNPDSTTHLLPNYDEFGIAYKDRDAFFNPEYIQHLDLRGNALFQHMIIYKGHISGLWKRMITNSSISIAPQFFTKPSVAEYSSFKKAVRDYSKFLNIPVNVEKTH